MLQTFDKIATSAVTSFLTRGLI